MGQDNMHSNLNESMINSVCCREAIIEELELEIFFSNRDLYPNICFLDDL